MPPSILAAADARAVAQAAFDAKPEISERLAVVDALLGLASAHMAADDTAAAETVLGDLRSHLEHGVRSDRGWQMRASATARLAVAIDQKSGRHDEAIRRLNANLASVPDGGPEADAARLSLLTTRLQSHLALWQAAEAASTLAAARKALARMRKTIPERPASILAINLLLQQAAVASLRDAPADVEHAFAEALAEVDRLGGSDLGDLRRRIIRGWSSALKAQGKEAEATALVGRSLFTAPAPARPFAP